ncbi:MAG: GNAT family N-acetyltransferase [Anaerolineae bacterium]|nr:GNAT family N-acetyltransferase [Anaerolineae bacterium]
MSQTLTTSQGDVTIRPALPADGAALRALRIEALERHPEAFAADLAASIADPASVWEARVAQYADKEAGIISAAFAAGQAIGMLGLARSHWPKTGHGANFWGMYVNAGWRGLRVAEALIREGCDWARAHGVIVAKLGVLTSNTPAIRCYVRCGFTVYGVDPQVIAYNGVFYDELLMVKNLVQDPALMPDPQ